MSTSPKAATAEAGARIVAPSRRASRTVRSRPRPKKYAATGSEVVAHAEHDAAMGRGAVEPVLRDQRVERRRRRRRRARASRRAPGRNGAPAALAPRRAGARARAAPPSRPRRRRARCRGRRPPTARPSRSCAARGRRRRRRGSRRDASRRVTRADRDERHPAAHDADRVGEERGELARAERIEHVVEPAGPQQAVARGRRRGSQWTNGSSECGSTREPAGSAW